MARTFSDFESRLGYSFKDKALLRNALTHTSYANEHYRKKAHLKSNERIEFVGDAVLGLIVGGYIYRKYPDMPEGRMSKLRASVVCETALADIAVRLYIDEFLRLGIGEEQSGGRKKASLLADALESVIGAVYIEGGFETAQRVMLVHLAPEVDSRAENTNLSDYKSRLQELLSKKHMVASYEIITVSGPDHDRVFTARVYLADGLSACGAGRSKKEAEQEAAKELLQMIV